MKAKTKYVLCLCIFLFSACSDDAAGPDGWSITRSWNRQSENEGLVTLTFLEDGTFTAIVESENDGVTGTYTLIDTQISLIDTGCGQIRGDYDFSIGNDTLTFSLIADNCSERANVVAGVWNRKQ